MSTPKGYPSSQKLDRLSSQFATVEQVREKTYGLSNLVHQFVRVVGTDAVDSASVNSAGNCEEFTAAAHAAVAGDVVRFTSGAHSGKEIKVYKVTTNVITLAEDLASAPAAADTFQILRHKYPVVDANGNLTISSSTGPIQYVLDGVDTEVEEDTVTPANNRPLPVKLMGTTGPINITAGDLNVQLSHLGANADSTRIGDGTNLLGITASNEAKVAVTAALPAGTNNIGDVDVVSSVLPTGAATAANQATEIASLASIDGKLNSLGQKAMAASVPVVVASDQSAIPASQSGTWNINNVAGTVSLPTGASTLAEQQTQTTSLQLLDDVIATTGAAITAKGAAIAGTDGTNARILKTDAAGELQIDVLSSALPSGAATEATLASIDGKLNSLGQKAMAASVPVVVASDQSAIPASQSGTWNINNVSGTVSLPTGAATAANQTTANASLASIDGKLNSLGQKAMAASAPVVIASDQSAIPASQSGTWNINNVSGTVSLPTGAATEATLSAISGKLPATLGQKAMAASLAVVLASDQSSIPVTSAALDVVDFIDTTPALDTSSTNIAGSASNPTAVVASLAANVKKVQFLDTTGAFIGLYTGAALSEVLQAVFGPGSDQTIDVALASGERVSLKRLDSTTAISSGIVAINFLG